MIKNDNKTISIVVPCFNEQAVLHEFNNRLCKTLDKIALYSEIIYVNDGSTDETQQIIEGYASSDPRVAWINLSRNFGKEIAMTAGLDKAKGDAVVIIDADLQDPPELIATLVDEWNNGFDVVYARRSIRDGESWLKKTTASIFYKIIEKLSRVPIPRDTGDFRLMSRRAVDALINLREHHRFMKGLFSWIGFSQKEVTYRRDPRYAGATKFNYRKLWNLAIEGITSFSIAPLKIASYAGILTALSALFYGSILIIKTIIYGEEVKGYPSIMVTILFLGGVQLLCIGTLGEYLGRIFNETKNRPLYIIQGYEPSKILKNASKNDIT